MKIRSFYEFEKALDSQFGWRKQELTSLRLALKSARNHQLNILFRGGVVLLYAHWEGIIRYSAECYLEYIVKQGQSYKQLKPCFLFFAVKKEIDSSGKPNLQNFSTFEKTQDMFTIPLDAKFDIDPKSYISTKENQNITSFEFQSIIKKLGLNYLTQYQLREKLIDDQLLYYRNTIAHGEPSHEKIDDPLGTFEILTDKILDSLALLRNQMTEAIRLKHYLAAPSE